MSLSSLDGSFGFSVPGILANVSIGQRGVSGGGINGDGLADIIISANTAAATAGASAGLIYVIFGSTGFGASVDLSTLSTGGMVLEGSGAFEQAGRSIEFIGDFDGDSYGDFLVGAYRGDGSGADLSYTGEAYVIYGDASGNLPTTLTLGTGLTGTNGFTLVGINADDFTGNHVSGAGDVNGDGFADILIGAYNADGASNALSTAGTAIVVFGGATGTVDTSGTFNLSSLNGSTGFAVHGSATFDNVGFESASAGDVNGDGLDDVIIGVPGGGTNGDAYVVFGQTSAFSAEFDVTASGLFKFNGTTSVSGGYNVSAAGDVNGDGYDDFLISQHRINANAGDGHLIFGGENLAGVTVNQGTLGGARRRRRRWIYDFRRGQQRLRRPRDVFRGRL